jgi:hypothetical protein
MICKCKHSKDKHTDRCSGKQEPSGECWPTSDSVCSICKIYGCYFYRQLPNLEYLEYCYYRRKI